MINLIIIPARSGSKGIKNKNIKRLNKKELIKYTLDSCKNINIPNKFIIVSSDNKFINKIAEEYGFYHNYVRPKSLAKDSSKIQDAVLHVSSWVEKKFNKKVENIILLQPTSPLRKIIDIEKSFKHFKRLNLDSLVSVTPVIQSMYDIGEIRNNKLKKIIKDNKIFQRQQEKKSFYFIDGSIYIASLNFIKRNKSFLNKDSYPFVLKRKYSIDIDDNEDFSVAEKIIINGK